MENEVLILRAVEPEDVDFMLECESDSEAALWSDYRAPLSRNQLLEYALTYDADPFRSGQLRLIVVSQEGERLGIVDLYDISERDLRAFVGICIHPLFRKRGYGLKALRSLESFALKRMGLKTLVSKVSTLNQPAFNLFTSAGYRSIAVLPSWHRVGGAFQDFHLLCR